jgi:hypothetical protein
MPREHFLLFLIATDLDLLLDKMAGSTSPGEYKGTNMYSTESCLSRPVSVAKAEEGPASESAYPPCGPSTLVPARPVHPSLPRAGNQLGWPLGMLGPAKTDGQGTLDMPGQTGDLACLARAGLHE